MFCSCIVFLIDNILYLLLQLTVIGANTYPIYRVQVVHEIIDSCYNHRAANDARCQYCHIFGATERQHRANDSATRDSDINFAILQSIYRKVCVFIVV